MTDNRDLTTSMKKSLETKQGQEPIIIIKIGFSFGTRYYAEKNIEIPGLLTQERLMNISDFYNQINTSSVSSIKNVSVTLDDSDGELKRFLDFNNILKSECIVYHYFENLSVSDMVPILSGELSNPVIWSEAERTLTFDVVSNILEKEVGYSIKEESESIPKELVGQIFPLGFGTCLKVPATIIQRSPKGVTQNKIEYDSTQIYIQGGNNFPQKQEIDFVIRGTVFRGQFDEEIFIISESNINMSSAITLAPRPSDDPDYGNASVCWIDETQMQNENIRLENQVCWIQYGVLPMVANWCIKQVGNKCYFNRNWQYEETKFYLSNTVGGVFEYCRKYCGSLEESNKYFYPIESGASVYYKNFYPTKYVCNLGETDEILEVLAERTVEGINRLVPVPSRYYRKNLSDTFDDQTVTTLIFDRALPDYPNENWSENIYVSYRSKLGSNTSDILKWIIENYTNLTVDTASFNDVKIKLENYPSHFALMKQGNALQICQEIAWQARCALSIRNNIIYLYYLSLEPDEIYDIDESKILLKTLEISYTEDYVTKLVANWRTNYYDDYKKTIMEYNINKYHLVEQEFDFYIYNIESLVEKSLTFWRNRLSNIWKRVSLKTTLNPLGIDIFDCIKYRLKSRFISNIDIKSIIEDIKFDSLNYELQIISQLPLIFGKMERSEIGEEKYWLEDTEDAPDDPGEGLSEIDYVVNTSDNPYYYSETENQTEEEESEEVEKVEGRYRADVAGIYSSDKCFITFYENGFDKPETEPPEPESLPEWKYWDNLAYIVNKKWDVDQYDRGWAYYTYIQENHPDTGALSWLPVLNFEPEYTHIEISEDHSDEFKDNTKKVKTKVSNIFELLDDDLFTIKLDNLYLSDLVDDERIATRLDSLIRVFNVAGWYLGLSLYGKIYDYGTNKYGLISDIFKILKPDGEPFDKLIIKANDLYLEDSDGNVGKFAFKFNPDDGKFYPEASFLKE